MDELWWSMRDRVGALSMIECLANSWQAAGREVGEMLRREGASPSDAARLILEMLGKKVDSGGDTLQVSSCPLWDRILEKGLEYAFRCEEFACTPLMKGLVETLGGKDAKVELSLRQVHVERAKLKYKLSKLAAAEGPEVKEMRDELERKLSQLPEHPVCRIRIKWK